MIGVEKHWWLRLTEMFASAFRREVKTPLSFFFRIVGAIAALGIVGFFTLTRSDTGDALRLDLFFVAVGALMVMFAVVCALAIFTPKNLVYGETGHRAEFKMSFGTERALISPEALAATPGVLNLPPTVVDESERA